MSSPLPFPPAGFDELSRREQLNFIEKLLDYIAPEEKCVEIPDWHREILVERLAHYREVGFQGRPWEEIKQELDKELEQHVNH